ncbi:MAG: hypothetical protein L7F78_14755, partial [Syntrophales bacterium LBB04]|nr:hypothetical protein [Syntrophales bacterium LBB04]
ELVNFCEALSRYQKSIQGRLGIVTGSGGHGALAVDIGSGLGLSFPQLIHLFQVVDPTTMREKRRLH